MDCEICGASGATKKVKVAGSELAACDKCASLGRVKKNVQREEEKKTKPSPKSTEPEEVLRRDYGDTIKEERESRDLSMEELGKKLGEKESTIRRVENQELRPDRKLAKKLKRELGVELFIEYEGAHENKGSDGNKLTIGDVAEIK